MWEPHIYIYICYQKYWYKCCSKLHVALPMFELSIILGNEYYWAASVFITLQYVHLEMILESSQHVWHAKAHRRFLRMWPAPAACGLRSLVWKSSLRYASEAAANSYAFSLHRACEDGLDRSQQLPQAQAKQLPGRGNMRFRSESAQEFVRAKPYAC
jgi:hypothetical protein